MEDGAMVALKATRLFCIDRSCLVTTHVAEHGIVVGNCLQPGDQNGGGLDVKPCAKAVYNIYMEVLNNTSSMNSIFNTFGVCYCYSYTSPFPLQS